MIGSTWLLIALSHGGYWFGGTTQQIEVSYRLERPMPAAELEWELKLGRISIAAGHRPVPADGRPLRVELTAPAVRAPVALMCNLRLVAHATGQVIEFERKPVWLLPPVPIEPIARLSGRFRLIIVDADDRFSSFLERHDVDVVRLDSLDRLAWANADLVIVNLDEPSQAVLSGGGIRDMLSSGARILLVARDQPDVMAAPKSIEHDRTSHIWRLMLPSRDYQDDPRVQMAIFGALDDVMHSRINPPEKPAARRPRPPASPGWILTPPGEE